jgi:hypothetical protein
MAGILLFDPLRSEGSTFEKFPEWWQLAPRKTYQKKLK